MWLVDVQSELERERAMRVYVFPRLKKDGKLTETEAQQRLERLGEAITVVQMLRDAGIHQTAQIPLRLTPATAAFNKEDRLSNLRIIKDGE